MFFVEMAEKVMRAELTMDTVEIAEMTGKPHHAVLRSGRRMLRSLAEAGGLKAELSSFESTYRERGRNRPCLLLPAREATLLMMGCWKLAN